MGSKPAQSVTITCGFERPPFTPDLQVGDTFLLEGFIKGNAMPIRLCVHKNAITVKEQSIGPERHAILVSLRSRKEGASAG